MGIDKFVPQCSVTRLLETSLEGQKLRANETLFRLLASTFRETEDGTLPGQSLKSSLKAQKLDLQVTI